jgi:hypothetical protein
VTVAPLFAGAAQASDTGVVDDQRHADPLLIAPAPLPRNPWEAAYSPWSELNTITVFAATSGRLASASNTPPIWRRGGGVL